MQLDAAKIQSKDAQSKLKAEVNIEQMKADYAANLQDLQNKSQMQIQKLIAQANEQQREHQQELKLAIMEAQIEASKQFQPQQRAFEIWKEKLESETKILVAEISKAAQLNQGQASSAEAAVERNPLPDIHIHMPSGNKKIIKNADGTFTTQDVATQH